MLVPQHITLEPQNIIMKPQHIIINPQHIIMKSQYIIIKAQHIIMKPQHIILNHLTYGVQYTCKDTSNDKSKLISIIYGFELEVRLSRER